MPKIVEIFASIQGESSHAGLPFVFVRLSGCNLRCRYCDTSYAWEGGEELGVAEVVERVAAHPIRRVSVTGGEPLLQPESFDLVRALLDRGCEVLVETNGAVPISPLDRRAAVVMDVKCPSSGEADRMLWENFDALSERDEVKFVVADEADYAYAKEVLARYRPGRGFRPLLSPAFGRMPPDRLAEWMVADALDARFQLQLHKVVWDPGRRGV